MHISNKYLQDKKRKVEKLKKKRENSKDKPVLNARRFDHLPSLDEIEKMKQIIRQEWAEHGELPIEPKKKVSQGFKLHPTCDSIRIPKIYKVVVN